jgi:hypothetical protein
VSTTRQKKRLGTEQLERVIDLIRSLEQRGLDPFLIDVDNVLKIIHEYFPEWEKPEELNLDAEAVNQIASAIELQSEWVKHRSSTLYTDPFLVEEKLRRLAKEDIGRIFLQSWHPIVQLEQLSPLTVAEAMKYWQSLVPLEERWQQGAKNELETGKATRGELLKQQIIAEEEFSQELEKFWKELKRRVADAERIEYWHFIGADTYEETVKRAYLVSFLVTYGYATLEVDRLEETIHIIPFNKPLPPAGSKQAASLPIPISIDAWEHWRHGGEA